MSDPVASQDSGVRADASSLLYRIDQQVRQLYPGYFALVMATGIISNAALYLGHRALSNGLFAVNLAADRKSVV